MPLAVLLYLQLLVLYLLGEVNMNTFSLEELMAQLDELLTQTEVNYQESLEYFTYGMENE